MNLPLRQKFFRSLIGFLFFVYVLLLAVLATMEVREAVEEGSSVAGEMPEIIAFAGVIVLTLPLGLLFAWHVSGRLLQPLRYVVDTAERIRRGNLDDRVPQFHSDDELSKLGHTINDAFDRYAATVRRLESFSANASHQLRTPLTGIRLSAEVALQRDRTSTEYKEAFGEILDQTGRLSETVDQLLSLARMDQSIRKDFVPLVLGDCLREWVGEIGRISDRVTITYDATAEASGRTLSGNATLLRQCFDNLLNNALSITPEGGRILVRLDAPEPGELVWSVEDSGPGIPAAERALIFDRFYQSKARSTGGSGLGLAIVREIVSIHGGSVQADQSSSLGGAALMIRLPAEKSYK